VRKKTEIRLRQIQKLIFTVLLIVLAGGIGFRLGWRRRGSAFVFPSDQTDLSLFWHVWQRLEDKYLDHSVLDSSKMVYGAISGMVSALDDPYTAFFPPQDNKVNKEDLSGEFGGVGIRLGYKDHILAVVSPLDGTPAYRAGVKAGDLILGIKDEKKNVDCETNEISLPEAVKLIRGQKGTTVVLTLARDEEEGPFDVPIVRGRIVVPSLRAEWLESNDQQIAYIHILQFSEVMYDQWREWTEEVVRNKNRLNFAGVILDLRNNPGGFLDGAVFVASEFIDGGIVVEQESSDGRNQVYRASGRGKLFEVPLVILVNRGSASAAEILAGSLQYYQRGEVIGEKTFGKGTVQEPEDFPDGSGLHITISRWLIPGGKSIDKEGVFPDVVIEEEMTDEEDLILEKSKEILLNK